MQTTAQILGKAHRLCDWLRTDAATKQTGVSGAALAWGVADASKWHIGDVSELPEIADDCSDYPPLRMPDSTMLIEYETTTRMADGRTEAVTGFCLCRDGSDEGVSGIDVFSFVRILGRFGFAGGGRLHLDRTVSLFRPTEDLPRKMHESAVANAATIVGQTLLLLSCTNVRSVDNVPPAALNRKRTKTGKPPLFTYKTLHVIAGESASHGNQREQDDEARRSPRLHFRRGHVRRIGDGRITWVQQCMVGNKRLGVVEKAYALEAR